MHVLQLGPYPPPEGGVNRNMLAIRADLVKDGHNASIIATSRSSRIAAEEGVFHPGSAFALIRLLISLRRDITHLHIGGLITSRVLALAFTTALLSRGKSIVSIHSGGYPHTAEGKAARRWSIRGVIFRMFDRVIVVNTELREVFVKYGVRPERVSVILPFVNEVPDDSVEIPSEIGAFAAKHKPFLLTVGLLEPEYDLAMQIDTMARVIENYPDAGLMIIGSGSLERELSEHIASKQYRENIHLAGDVPHAITLHMIERAAILLRTTRFDGDAISIREALFLGTPVVATDNGMRPEGVRLFEIGNANEFVEAITAAVATAKADPVEKFEEKTNIAAIIDLYGEIIP